MFEILSKAVSSMLSRLLSAPIDFGSKKLAWRRSAAGRFFELFDALACLVESSIAAERSFSDYCDRRSATKIVIRNRLSALFTDVERFSKAMSQVESKLKIYDRDLFIDLSTMFYAKERNLITLDFLTDVLPKPIENTHQVIYPKNLPSLKELTSETLTHVFPSIDPTSSSTVVKETSAFPSHLRRSYEPITLSKDALRELKKRILPKFEMQQVDLLAPEEARIALENARMDIRQLERIRDQLADFIKQKFPLDSVLM